MTGFEASNENWQTIISTATYNDIETEDWKISYWVGGDFESWQNWDISVEVLGGEAEKIDQ